MPPSQARRIGLRTHLHEAAVALRAYARGQTIRHRTAAVALRPGHSAVSLWLNSGSGDWGRLAVPGMASRSC